MAGRSFVARFSVAIEGLLHQALQLLARVEGHDAARRDGNLFPSLRIAAGPLGFLSELEIAKTRKLDHLPALQGDADLLEEGLHHVLRLALVQPDLLEHEVGELRLGEGDFVVFHVRGSALNSWESNSLMEATTSSTSESVKVLSVSCITIRNARLYRPASTPFPRYWSKTSNSRTQGRTRPRTASSTVARGTSSARR